jgi:hypothetical protein
MAKMTRGDLKEIVKECLVEIFSEMGTQITESRTRRTSSKARPSRAVYEDQRLSRMRQVLDERPARSHAAVDNVEETVSTVTNDPLLSRILADTAQTTMLEQHAAESGGAGAVPGDSAARAMAAADPLDLFGESASNWATLAFTEKKGM